MPRKNTRSGLVEDRGSAITYTNSYYYATDESKYYLSDGVSWKEQSFDFDDVSPETDTVLVTGISPTGAIDPAKLNNDGSFKAPSGAVINRSGTIAASNTSQLLASANNDRKYLFIQNLSNADMYVGVGFTPTVSTGILLVKSGGVISWDRFIPTGRIEIICDTVGKAFTALEG